LYAVAFLLLLQKQRTWMLPILNVSSETNPDLARFPTARNWAQLVWKDMWLSCTCVGWNEASLQNWRLHRTIIRHFGEKDTLRFWTSLFVM